MRYCCLKHDRGYSSFRLLHNQPQTPIARELYWPMSKAIMCHSNLLSPVFLEVVLVSLLRHNRPNHYTRQHHALSLSVCWSSLLGVLLHISQKPPPNGLNRTFWVAKKKVHNFVRLSPLRFTVHRMPCMRIQGFKTENMQKETQH